MTCPTLEPTAGAPSCRLSRWQIALEIALVFAIFAIQGSWPAPDVNEPYYLGKAIHYWNPTWVPNDFFLDSADTHTAFYFTLGWMALWLPPLALAWVGRLVTWALLAWAWRRLSWALLPRRWCSLLTAALFVGAVEWCSMAGEWVVGGVEAKGFAYVLVLLGIEALVRGRWNWAWILFGAGALFHVLVGGWAVVAAGVAWCLAGSERPTLRSMAPGLVIGFLLSLPGLIPSLSLTWGVDPEIVRRANWIYVYERLPHHLELSSFPTVFLLRFAGLLVIWLVLCRLTPRRGSTGRLQGFVSGAIAIGIVGLAVNALALIDPVRAAGLLRFYWFRLVDVTVPLGVALLSVWWINQQQRLRPVLGKGLLAAVLAVAVWHVGNLAVIRPVPTVPRTVPEGYYHAWRDVCSWIAASPDIPPDARFLTPRLNHTFKWYTGRSEVATWKDIPQDAESIVEWWDRMERLYGTGIREPAFRWRRTMAWMSPQQLRDLGTRYGANYLLTTAQPRLDLELLYRNRTYAVYRLTPVCSP